MSLSSRARTLLIVLLGLLAASIPTLAHASPAFAVIDLGYDNQPGKPTYGTLALSQSGTTIGVTYPDGTAGSPAFPGQEVTAVNDHGDAVGFSKGSTHAVLFQGGTTTYVDGYQGGQAVDLGTLGGTWSQANALNDADQVAGVSGTGTNGMHAFLYSDGKMTDLGTLGGNGSVATAISSNGLVVGTSETATNQTHGFLYAGGKMIDIGVLSSNADSVSPVAVNASGQVVGTDYEPSGSHAFLYSNGKMIDLFGPNTKAIGINDSGQVIGYSDTANVGLLYSGGKVYKLDSLIRGEYSSWSNYLSSGAVGAPSRNWIPTMPRFINDQGQIVAYAYVPGSAVGYSTDVLMTPVPVPEPSTLAVFAVAVVAGLGWRRGRRPA